MVYHERRGRVISIPVSYQGRSRVQIGYTNQGYPRLKGNSGRVHLHHTSSSVTIPNLLFTNLINRRYIMLLKGLLNKKYINK